MHSPQAHQPSHDKIDESTLPTAREALLALAKGAISEIPGGSMLMELLSVRVSKRQAQFLKELSTDLDNLKEQVEGFHLETLAENDAFVSTTLEVLATSVRTHQAAKLKAARNIVLNAALPNAPNDNLQKMFVTWLDQLTEWHLVVLRLAQDGRLPEIDFSTSNWAIHTSALDKLSDVIESEYPEFNGRHSECIQLLRDLYMWGLVSNHVPSKGRATFVVYAPLPTPLARQFLKFIESPLEDENENN